MCKCNELIEIISRLTKLLTKDIDNKDILNDTKETTFKCRTGEHTPMFSKVD